MPASKRPPPPPPFEVGQKVYLPVWRDGVRIGATALRVEKVLPADVLHVSRLVDGQRTYREIGRRYVFATEALAEVALLESELKAERAKALEQAAALRVIRDRITELRAAIEARKAEPSAAPKRRTPKEHRT